MRAPSALCGVLDRRRRAARRAKLYAKSIAHSMLLPYREFETKRSGERTGFFAWDSVDLKRDLITIHQHKTPTQKALPISSALRALLVSLSPGIGNALVFRKPDGSPFQAMDIQRAFAVALNVSKSRQDVSVHSIRHTVGSWLKGA